MTEEPKSKSGPLPSGQLGPLTPETQAELKASLAVTCLDQMTRPVARSSAITESLRAVAGGE